MSDEKVLSEQLSNVWVCMAEQGGIPHDWIEVIGEAVNELTENQNLFELRWKADQRARKLWQEETGKKDTWPDHTDLVVFLMRKLDEAQSRGGKK